MSANPLDLISDGMPTKAELSVWWDTYGYLVQTLGGGAVLTLLLGTLAYTKLRRRPLDGWVSTTVTFLVLVYQSHGMWGLIDRELHLPLAMKIAGFFIMEALVLFFGAKARRRFEATIAYDKDDPQRVVANGRPGWPGALVWLIAILSGMLVGLSEDGWIAFFFRFFIGVIAAAMWWANLTEDRIALDVKRRKQRTRWRWTPSRLMVEWGWLEPDEDDLQDTNDKWLARKLTKLAMTHHTSIFKPRRALAGWRLTTWAKRATEEVLAEVRKQLIIINTVKDRTNPNTVIGDRLTEQQAHYESQLANLTEWAAAERSELMERHSTEVERLRAALAEQQEEAQKTLEEAQLELAQRLEQVRAEAVEQIHTMQAELEELRPAAKQAAVLSRQLDTLQAGSKGTARANGSAESVPSQRSAPGQGEPVGSPTARAATSGTTALQPDLAPQTVVQTGPKGQGPSARQILFGVWDQLLANDTIDADARPRDLVAAAKRAGVEVDNEESAARNARTWKQTAASVKPEEQGKRVPGVHYLEDRKRPGGQ